MTEQRRTIEGIDVHIEGEGEQTLLMVHGWPDTYRLWDEQVEHLRSEYRCIRFTLPGFDVSKASRPTSLVQMVELFKTIVQELAPGRRVTLLLHDWGCVFGYEFALRHPDLVARVIGVDIGDHNSSALRRCLTAKARWGIFTYQIWLALAWIIGGRLGTWMTRRMARSLRCRSNPAYIGAQMNYPYHMRWFNSHGSLRGAMKVEPVHPMLFLYGQRKPFMFHSPGFLDRLAERPGSAAIGFATGHWVMSQQAAAFNQCISQWLADGTGEHPAQ